MKESNIQKLIQLAASENEILTFRNNIGSYITPEGYRVNYGVGGKGGSDLIGITPMTVTADMVGRTIGVFTAIEVKTHTGRVTPSQANFIQVVRNNSAIAGVCRSTDDLLSLILTYKNQK